MLMGHEQRYAAAWKDLRFRGWLSLGLFLAILPCTGLAAILVGSIWPVVPAVIGIGLGIVWIGSALHRSTFPCPRCGQWFFMGAGHNPLSGGCMHCGLKIGAPYDAANHSGTS